MQKIFSHIGIGEVVYTKRARCRSIKISVSYTRGIRVSLPFYTPYARAVDFVDANISKIASILQKQEQRSGLQGENGREVPGVTKTYTPDELKKIRIQARKALPQRLVEISERLNSTIIIRNKLGVKLDRPFSYNRLAIKNNRTNWGSCSSARNINLNMHLVGLPQELADFVIIHELCHLVYPNHSPRFHELVNMACGGDEKELSRRLKAYRPAIKSSAGESRTAKLF